MTNQELFDKVRAYSLTMTERCVQSSGACIYLDAKTGNRCFIGALIPKGKYKAWMHEDAEPGFRIFRVCGISAVQNHLACRLQGIHDGSVMSAWPKAFDELAEQEGLTA